MNVWRIAESEFRSDAITGSCAKPFAKRRLSRALCTAFKGIVFPMGFVRP